MLNAIASAGVRPTETDRAELLWLVRAGVPHVEWFLSIVRRVFIHAVTPAKPRRWLPPRWTR